MKRVKSAYFWLVNSQTEINFPYGLGITIIHKNNETKHQILPESSISYVTYTEMVNFTPQR